MSTMCVRLLIITLELYVTSGSAFPKTSLSIATSWVGARLDYCNAIFYGTSRHNIHKLQRVQNTLARVVKERGKYDHVTPLLSQLQWLPIEARIRHKIAVLTFKAVATGKPSHLAELIHTHAPAKELRSS